MIGKAEELPSGVVGLPGTIDPDGPTKLIIQFTLAHKVKLL